MGSFGDKLRREREMRGVTLDEISESTKISRRHLESLEKEDFESLPGGVFNKGFVRAYARFLGIDQDQAVADYVAVAGDAAPPEDKFPLEIHEEPNRELNPRRSNAPLLLAVAALVGVMIGYGLWVRNKKAAGLAEGVSANTPAPVAATQPHAAASTPRGGVEVQVASRTPVPAPEKAAARKKPLEEAQSAHKKAEHTFFIVIKAKEDSWISVIADGRTVTQGVLNQDKQRLIKAGKEIILKTGNAGGIEVSYNGRTLGAIGSESETRTLMFTPSGPAQ